jgi:hypothetical protein
MNVAMTRSMPPFHVEGFVIFGSLAVVGILILQLVSYCAKNYLTL